MKLGCIIKLFAMIIVFIGIGYYVVEKYSDEIVLFGKNKVDQFIEEKIETEFDKFKNKDLLDSLKFSVTEYFENKDFSEINSELPELFNRIKLEIESNMPDSIDYKSIKKRIFEND